MKRENQYTAWLLALALTFTACDTIEPDFFDENYNGAYFDYQNASDYETTLNFADYVVGNPQAIPVTLNVKLLGYLTDESRTLSIKTKEVEDYEFAKVVLPEITFGNKEYQKDIEILVERPEVENKTYAVCIYLDGEGDLGTGIAGKNEYVIYVNEVHEHPTWWGNTIIDYLGAWSRERHAFLANVVNDNYYYNSLFYDAEKKEHNAENLAALNIKAVNAQLAEEATEQITNGMPILRADQGNYDKPYFWDKYSEYLGLYSSKKFCNFTHTINGANTQNIVSAYENSKELMEKNKMLYNKEDVKTMLDEYYELAKAGYTISECKEEIWVKIYPNESYTDVDKKEYLRKPYWWEDPDSLGTAKIVEEYFGEYNHRKYQFMLITMINIDGEDDFNAASILPFKKDGNKWAWDEEAGGEARIKECYEIIKDEYENLPSKKQKEIGIIP